MFLWWYRVSDSLQFLADFKERFFTCGCDHAMTAGLVVKEPNMEMCSGSVVRGGEGGVMSYQFRQYGPQHQQLYGPL